MQIRTNCPYKNKYYIMKKNGGLNGAIQGKPTKIGANVLANCVGYANGRFAEIQGLGLIRYQFTCNAENFIEKAKSYGLKVAQYPTLGGIMVWQKGATLGNSDGAGHVAIVERLDGKDKIYTSESSYSGTAFYNANRVNTNGRWGMNSNYKFRGCIVNPVIGDIHYVENSKIYDIGMTYVTKVDLKVRTGAGTEYRQKKYSELTVDAQKHSYKQTYAVLKAGTKVTCQGVYIRDNQIWLKIPSGFVCAYNNGKEYIK